MRIALLAGGGHLGLEGTEFVAAPLDEAAGGARTLEPTVWELARSFFG